MTKSVNSETVLRQSVARDLLTVNRKRAKVRRWILTIFTPLLLILALLVAKLLSMYVFAYQSITSYMQGNFSATVVAGERQEFLNWFEPYKAPFNHGVGLAASENLDEARTKFELSLSLATGDEQCIVRVNLALVLERLADVALQDGMRSEANVLVGEALTVLNEMPEECGSPLAPEQLSDPTRNPGEEGDEIEDRLLQRENEPKAQPGPETEGDAGPSGEQLEELADLLQQGEQDRVDGQLGEFDDQGTDRPW